MNSKEILLLVFLAILLYGWIDRLVSAYQPWHSFYSPTCSSMGCLSLSIANGCANRHLYVPRDCRSLPNYQLPLVIR